MSEAINKAKALLANSLPFFLYKEPGEVVDLITNSANGCLEGLIIEAHGDQGKNGGALLPQTDTAKNEFTSNIERAKAAFAQGEMSKVVLSRVRSIEQEKVDAPALFAAAVQRLPNAFIYLLNSREHGLWIGASPERLLAYNGSELEIDSIAATRNSDDTTPAHHWNEKERHEQLLVTKRISSILESFSPGMVNIEGPKVLNAGPVSHLHSIIRAVFAKDKLAELLALLHPTPALGGSPKEEAAKFIGKHEQHERRLYTGYLGVKSSDDSMRLYVNIRCMQLFPNKAQLYLGCGITAGSNAEDEWLETERKARTWLDILAHGA